MSSSADPDETRSSGQDPSSLLPDDALPPVEPPSAGFLLQLFVVPGLIVAVIVVGWLALSWLARGSDDLGLLIKRIRVPSEGRFQAAHQLASALASGRHEDFKRNREAASQLAVILDEELAEGSTGEKSIHFRMFLCRVLGELHVDEGIDALLKAATLERDEEEVHVRQAAIAAIAIRAERAATSDPPGVVAHPGLGPTMLGLATDPDRRIREVTAVALGWIGTEPLLHAARTMLDDPDPNVRYNAATALARHGDSAVVGVLLEMLDPDEMAGVETERIESARPFKRTTIRIGGLRAARLLAERNREIDIDPLARAVRRLTLPDVDRPIRVEAIDVLDDLTAGREPAGALPVKP